MRITLTAALWIVYGCTASSSSDGPGGPLEPSFDQPTQESAAPSLGSDVSDLPASVLDPVIAEVARLAGVPIDQVVVVSGEAITFPDGSLGCPQPGMAYTQVLVDGYKVVAEAGGKTYDFRGTGSTFRLCPVSR